MTECSAQWCLAFHLRVVGISGKIDQLRLRIHLRLEKIDSIMDRKACASRDS